jgi:hypothetical protein
MINSGYYIQLVRATSKCRNAILKQFDKKGNEFFYELDEIRVLYEKIHSNVEGLRIRKFLNMEEIEETTKELCGDLKRICDEFEIKVLYNKKNSESWKASIYANFYLHSEDITDLIIVNKKQKPIQVSNAGE